MSIWSKQSILIIAPECWDDHAVSKHHYAKALADRGARVVFLNPPNGTELKIESVQGKKNLSVVTSPRVASGLRFYPAFIPRLIESRWLSCLEKTLGTTFSIVWLFENSRFFDMRFAGSRLKIYHQVDLNQASNPERASSTANICFCTSDFIRARLLPYNPSVYKIQHGLALASRPGTLSEEQLRRFAGRGPHAVYVGNLEIEYLDAELLMRTAARFKEVKFHFVGGYKESCRLRQLAAALPNVVWWGKVCSLLIPAILARADVLLVSYKAEQHREQLANPHKIMEYLGSGKAIVSTYTAEYKDKRHLLEMVDDSTDFVDTFGRVVENLPTFNSDENQRRRIEYAEAHSYPHQLDKIFALLKQHRLISD